MAINIKSHYFSLYQEHLEEGGFLYEQRLGLHSDDDVSWIEIAEFEKRLEAHISALVIGKGRTAEFLEKCIDALEYDQVFVAVSACCRLNLISIFLEYFENIDFDDTDIVVAITDALVYCAPEHWIREMVRMPFDQNPHYLKVLMPVFIRHGLKANSRALDAVVPYLEDIPSLIEKCWSGQQEISSTALDELTRLISSDYDVTRYHALSVLLVAGYQNRVQQAVMGMPSKNIGIQHLVISSDGSIQHQLTSVPDEKVSLPVIAGLGLLGLVEAIPRLIKLLTEEAFAKEAASALYAITGAPLYSETFIPDEVDEDELFEEEKASYQEGKAPMHIDRPFGSAKYQISQEESDWVAWIKANRHMFSTGKRYRLGLPISPINCVRIIGFEKTPHELRRYTASELIIRYKPPVNLDVNDWVDKQWQQLKALVEWGQRKEQENKNVLDNWYLEPVHRQTASENV